MKLSDYAIELIEMLSTELEARGGKAYFGEVYNYRSGEYETTLLNGMTVEDICLITGAEITAGACSQVFVLPEVVIKWAKPNNIHNSDAENDARVYERARAMGMEAYVAQTERVGFLTLQERILPAAEVSNDMPWDLYFERVKEVGGLAEALGLGDMHDSNWGFRPDDVNFTTPVMFDFSCARENPNY